MEIPYFITNITNDIGYSFEKQNINQDRSAYTFDMHRRVFWNILHRPQQTWIPSNK